MVGCLQRRLRSHLPHTHTRKLHKSRYIPTHHFLKASYGQDGEYLDKDFPVYNPANGEELCRVAAISSVGVKEMISGAQATFESGVWSKAPSLTRSKVLSKLARALEARIPDLARMETLQTGRTIREMNAQLVRLPEWLDYFAALLRTNQAFVAPTQGRLLNYIQRVPLGVVAQITPFNHPLLIAIKKIAPALAAGNSVIVKPSEHAPMTVLGFEDMAHEAGVPAGALSVLPGFGSTVGNDIVNNSLIRKVDVTAGTQTGRNIGRIAGANLALFTAELGGKAPVIVFDDADLESAVNGTAFSAFVASGQTCVSGARLIVQDGIYERFMQMFVAKSENIRRRMGDPLNPKSTMGSVISQKHLDRIDGMIEQTKGRVLVGGQQMLGDSALDGFDFSKGSFFPPTIITDVEIDDILWQEEIFGPVVVVKRFSDETQGVELANASRYGLGAGIWTSDLSRAHRVAADIQAGLCWVNTHHRNDPSSPWGGMKESGIGRENGVEAFEAYTQSKSTIINIASTDEMRENDDWFAESSEVRRYG